MPIPSPSLCSNRTRVAVASGRSNYIAALQLLGAAAIVLAAAAANAQVSTAPPTNNQAGQGRGADQGRQSVIAANQQADAAFLRADRNGDRKLSRAEADHLPAVAARFEQVDANRDQFISREEFNRVLSQ